jgi:hypothetical protein
MLRAGEVDHRPVHIHDVGHGAIVGDDVGDHVAHVDGGSISKALSGRLDDGEGLSGERFLRHMVSCAVVPSAHSSVM